MNNKKLIFIVGSPRSGSTLLLSYLCGLKNTRILYETKCLTNPFNFVSTDYLVAHLARVFDYFDEEIVIEKTPEHTHYLDVIEQLRKVCKRDIHVIYVTRPPVPTVLSILKANEALEVEDILGACEKYEKSLVSIYHNLITKTHKPNVYRWQEPINHYGSTKGSYTKTDTTDYSFEVKYSDLVSDEVHYLLYELLILGLHLDLSDTDIRSLVVSRVNSLTKVLFQIVKEEHHSNLFKEVDVVNKERLSNASSVVNDYKEEIRYITNYFNELSKRTNIYDLVSNKRVIEVKDNPLVTIVVPLFNKEKYIVDTLNSLLNQTYYTRVAIVDDVSTDKSLSTLCSYYNSLPLELKERLFILTSNSNQSNLGVSSARNRVLDSLIKTDIYSFCDADDVWDSTLVEKSVATFKKYPYVDCVYSRVLLDKDGEITKNYSKICNGDVYEDALEYNFLTCGSNLFVKASVIEEHNIRFNVEYNGCEDWDFLIQLAKVATFKCTKKYLVTYRQVPNSLSTNKELQVDNGKKVLESYISDNKKFSRIFTRLYLYYFSTKNLKWEHIKDLDFSFILRVIVSKLKSIVKSYIS